MFSIWPSDWQAPKPNWMNKQSNQPSWIPKPASKPKFTPKAVIKPTKSLSLKELNQKAKSLIPKCEMCIGENFDSTEIDAMLEAMDNPTEESNDAQVLKSITKILANINKNIKALEDGIDTKDGISRQELLDLLKTFSTSYQSIFEYLQNKIEQKNIP